MAISFSLSEDQSMFQDLARNFACLAGLSLEIPITTVFCAKFIVKGGKLFGFFGAAGSVSARKEENDHFFATLFGY